MSGDLERSREYRRAARQVLRWGAAYTRGLDGSAGDERLDELGSDLHEHAVWAGDAGWTPAQLARSIRSRAIRGVVDDLRWRRAQVRVASASSRLALRMDAGMLAAPIVIGLALGADGLALPALPASGEWMGRLGLVLLAVVALASTGMLAIRRFRAVAAATPAVPAALLPPLSIAALTAPTGVGIAPALLAPASAWLVGGLLTLALLGVAAYWRPATHDQAGSAGGTE